MNSETGSIEYNPPRLWLNKAVRVFGDRNVLAQELESTISSHLQSSTVVAGRNIGISKHFVANS